MALYYDLPVYKDVYRLILKIFEHSKDFPREMRPCVDLKILPTKQHRESGVLAERDWP